GGRAPGGRRARLPEGGGGAARRGLRDAQEAPPPRAGPGGDRVSVRAGLGIDAHRFGAGRPLMLGTLSIEHPSGLAGHSDGDVVAHALCDALLAAAGEPDIGALFPPGDPEWFGVSGEGLVGLVAERRGEGGSRPGGAQAWALSEEPRIPPPRERMQEALSAAVGAAVTVHATTTDGMGFTGRREGIACQAVALVGEAAS